VYNPALLQIASLHEPRLTIGFRSGNMIPGGGQLFLKIHSLFDLHQKPAVDFREVENLLNGESGAQGVADEEDAFGVGHAQLAADDVAREDVAVAIDFRADAPGFSVKTLSRFRLGSCV
jgi:hypothetical protein